MTTVDRFMQSLEECGLLSAEELRALSDLLNAGGGSEDARALRDELIQSRRLTAYQADAIYQGHPQRLMIGERYIIEELIGSGGMGVVYKAMDRRMHREVAIKMLLESGQQSDEKIERFRREAIAAARMNHPNIVTAYTANEHEGYPYLVMEYIKGRDLGSLVKKGDKLPVPEAVNYMLQTAIGMAYAHSRHIIHRDLKPSNLLLATPDDSDIRPGQYSRVKILDMGLARLTQPGGDVVSPVLAGSDLSATGILMGTVDYMAPEQAMDTKRADHRSDIYSLGCTLYFLLTKRPVYTGNNLLERISAHLKADIPSLTEARPEVTQELDAVFQKMVAKKPRDRYQTMTEVVEALLTIDRQLSGFGSSSDVWHSGVPGSSFASTAYADEFPSGGKIAQTGMGKGSIFSNVGSVIGRPLSKSRENPPFKKGGHFGNDGGSGDDGQNFPEQPGDSHPVRGDFDEAEWAKRDIVDCTVFAPPTISAQEAALIQVFAHIPKAAHAALVAAQEFDEDTKRRGSTTLGTLIEHGSKLSFEFQAKDLLVEAPHQELIWTGRTASVQFAVQAGNKAKSGTSLGKVLISQNSIPIGKIQFKMTIAASGRTPPLQIPEGEACRYHQAFISYASHDRPEVVRRVQMLKAVGIGFFQDVFDLSPGDAWEAILYQRIAESDVFFLFWSHAAKRSKWVEKEWRYALENKGDAFIQPIAIEGPPIPAPPQELAHLHFGDVILYFIPRSRFQAVWGFMKRLVKRN